MELEKQTYTGINTSSSSNQFPTLSRDALMMQTLAMTSGEGKVGRKKKAAHLQLF